MIAPQAAVEREIGSSLTRVAACEAERGLLIYMAC
jgi:hypothetical protein